jgi:hypothetical protein
MKVFISWSGDLSHQVAALLYQKLPIFIQAIDPWISSHDIGNGTLWRAELADQLGSHSVGIFCITRDNVGSVWVNFEAGALSRSSEAAAVIPFFFEMRPTDVAGPLRDFNGTIYQKGSAKNKEAFFKLLLDLNRFAAMPMVSEHVLTTTFDRMWLDLESSLDLVSEEATRRPDEKKPDVDTGSVLQELVLEFRNLQSLVASNLDQPDKVRDTLIAFEEFMRDYAGLVTLLSILIAETQEVVDRIIDPELLQEGKDSLREMAVVCNKMIELRKFGPKRFGIREGVNHMHTRARKYHKFKDVAELRQAMNEGQFPVHVDHWLQGKLPEIEIKSERSSSQRRDIVITDQGEGETPSWRFVTGRPSKTASS